MNAADLPAHLRQRLPGFTPTAPPVRLRGGYLNHVWRVAGEQASGVASVVAKHAPPYVAAMPDAPLDPARLGIEAACLGLLGPGGALADLSGPAVRPPRLLDYDAARHVLIMEDLGDPPALGAWLFGATPDEATRRGHALGTFIGTLHTRTHGDAALATELDNRAIQSTRLDVQYRAIGGLLEKAGLPDADALGAKAVALGEAFLRPGRCVIMGDLWPASLLAAPDGLRVIDWELAHYGRPAQDVGHLAAHLWMRAHRAPTPEAAEAVRAFDAGFRTSYLVVAGALFDDAECRAAAVHFGCEILVRTLGAFQGGYLYDGLPHDHAALREAVAEAERSMRGEAFG